MSNSNVIVLCQNKTISIITKCLNKTPRIKLKLLWVRCHQPELFPLISEVPETKTETVRTKLKELPETTTYHTTTYKHILGLAHCIGPKSENCIGPESGTD